MLSSANCSMVCRARHPKPSSINVSTSRNRFQLVGSGDFCVSHSSVARWLEWQIASSTTKSTSGERGRGKPMQETTILLGREPIPASIRSEDDKVIVYRPDVPAMWRYCFEIIRRK